MHATGYTLINSFKKSAEIVTGHCHENKKILVELMT